MSASSSELVEKSEADTSDSENSDVIPQLDGPAEDIAVMEENCVKEEETNLANLPTADDPDSFNIQTEQNVILPCLIAKQETNPSKVPKVLYA